MKRKQAVDSWKVNYNKQNLYYDIEILKLRANFMPTKFEFINYKADIRFLGQFHEINVCPKMAYYQILTHSATIIL